MIYNHTGTTRENANNSDTLNSGIETDMTMLALAVLTQVAHASQL
jgi:hypothetical protein